MEEEHSDTITKDFVIRFSPMEGKLLEKGDKVTIVVSLGPKEHKVTMPNVVGSKFSDIERQLSGMGLNRGKVDYQYSDRYAEGLIIWQSVSGEVDEGTVVDFWVSKGPEATEAPATEPPTAEPTEPPTQAPTQEPTPTPLPTDNVVAPTSTQTINVDLTNYERPDRKSVV